MSTNEKAISVIEPGGALDLAPDPEYVLRVAARAAKALQSVIENKEKKVIIRGEQYLEVGDWQTLGQFYGVSVRTESEPVTVDGAKGAKARAEVIDVHTGLVVAGAEASCLSNEESWADRPYFQLASMAQTRAASKALRNRLGWVAVLAGYRDTPAEEMVGEAAAPIDQTKHFCHDHNVPFRRHEKGGRVWYSHTDAAGQWCNEANAKDVAQEAPTNGHAEPPKAAGKAGKGNQAQRSGLSGREADPVAEGPEDPFTYCVRCGQLIEPHTKEGKTYPVTAIVKASMQFLGKPHCFVCTGEARRELGDRSETRDKQQRHANFKRDTRAQTGLATPTQVRAIYLIGRDQRGLSEVAVEQESTARYGAAPSELTAAQASEFIAWLKGSPSPEPPEQFDDDPGPPAPVEASQASF